MVTQTKQDGGTASFVYINKMSQNIDKNLEDINKQILEIKKKIQLSEGQRKAHFEEWDGEKKKNNDKIKQFKKEIKDLHLQLATCGQNVQTVLRASAKYPKEIGGLRKKSGEEIVKQLDCKATDLNKRLDLLRHESLKCQNKMKLLAEEYHTLLHRNRVRSEHPEIRSLENQIHRVDMNLMEAQHVRKKYRIIRNSLLNDSVHFESTLLKIEEAIKKQETEVNQLKEVYSEAVGLRDVTRGTLTRQELNAVNAAKSREKELQDLRFRVDERRIELERLERHIFPAGRSLVHQDSTSSLEQTESAADDTTTKTTDFLEETFNKLKAATGQTDSEEVLKRFLSQKDTLSRLTYLRNITEEEKKDLLKRKDYMLAELEAFKFAEVKDTEQNMDESDRVKQEINKEIEKKEKTDESIEKIMEELYIIRDVLHSFCIKLEDASGIMAPPACRELNNISDILSTLENQATNIIDRIGQGDDFDKKVVATNKTAMEDGKQTAGVLAVSETDDEDEVPSRGFLKRQAQVIVDAKSRRKQFPMTARGKKTLTIK
ncbi:hypothetical protein L9F63_022482 [Diploptera punctata]|uniref:Coiled-coil domain-containing protein 151 n=1 Tax=Diploptera punctata TaxID=6984 RepID=A0AAD8EB08_DIPPU|nr:hypothetical protein L9F63_022482 [Diploptera punctata]